MSSDKILLTIDEFRESIDLQKSYNVPRFQGYVRRVQREYLREVLSPALYFDMFSKIDETNYQNLINGTTYEDDGNTVEYFGINIFLTYHVAALMVEEGEIQFTESGTHEYNNIYSVNAKRKDVVNRYNKSAIDAANEIKCYLDNNSSDFPLWKSSALENPQSPTIMFI